MGTNMESKSEPVKMLRPGRKITGISSTLLPFRQNGKVDWNGFCVHVDRTACAGLVPTYKHNAAQFLNYGTGSHQTRPILHQLKGRRQIFRF